MALGDWRKKVLGEAKGLIGASGLPIAIDFGVGALKVKQSEVTAITTDAPLAVRLASGTHIDGKIATADGAVQIAGPDATITTTVAKVAASWAVGDEDPAVVALRRHWAYEASVDVTGTTGNKSQLGTAGGFRATLVSPKRWARSRMERTIASSVLETSERWTKLMSTLISSSGRCGRAANEV